ncbi:hypothetical protein V1477_014406 [Vespula maculifrons]|uniref:Uncharacterized protein n=1 Tax=Vespula maculifrons TaxID=7453 RepID=A0ABD2BKY5_VESMC
MVGNGWGEWKGRGRSNRRDFLRRDQDQSGYARFYAFHHVQQPHSKHVEEEEKEVEEEEEEEEDVLRSNTDSNVYSDSSRIYSDRKKAVRINVDVCGEWWEECEWPKTHASRVQSIGKSPFMTRRWDPTSLEIRRAGVPFCSRKKQKSSGAPKEEETKEEKIEEDEEKEEEEEEEEEQQQEKKKKRRRPGEF